MGGTAVTPEEVDEFVRLYVDEGLTQREVARRTGRVVATVREKLRERGVTMRVHHMTDEETDEAVRLYATGMTLGQVGRAVGHHDRLVRDKLTERGVKIRQRPLTASEERRIVAWRKRGLGAAQIAEKLGRSTDAVRRVLDRKGLAKPHSYVSIRDSRQWAVDYRAGRTVKQIAEAYSRPQTTVQTHLNRQGVVTREYGFPQEVHEEVVRLYTRERYSISEIRRVTGMSHATVHRSLTKQGVTLRPRGRTNRPSSNRVPHMEVLKAVVMYRDAGSIGETARRLGVSQSAVSRRLHMAGEPVTRHPDVPHPGTTPMDVQREVIRLYVEEDLTQKEVRARTGVAHATFVRILAAHGVPMRSRSEVNRRARAARQVPSG